MTITPPLFDEHIKVSKLFLAFFESDRLGGEITKSTCHFALPENLQSVQVKVNRQPVDGFGSIYADSLYNGGQLFDFLRLFNLTETLYTNNPNGKLTLDNFLHNKFVLSYDLTTAGVTATDSFPLLKQGEITLELKFSPSSTKEWICLAYAMSPSLIKVDKHRNIECDYPR